MTSLGRVVVAGSALLVIAGALAGCGSSSGTSGSADSSATEPHIAYLEYGLDSFTQAEINGTKKTAGGTMTVSNANYDPTAQQKQCEDAITSSQYNAIVLTPVQTAAAVPCVELAEEAEIPVFGALFPIGRDPYNISPQLAGVKGSVAQPFEENSELLYQLAEEACKGVTPCPIVIEIAALGDPITADYLKYFEKQEASSPNIEVAAFFETAYEPQQTLKKLPDILRVHPETKVILSVSDESAIVAINILKEEGLSGIKVIGNGGTYKGKELVESGELASTIANYPLTAGEYVGRMVKEYLEKGSVAKPTVNYFTVEKPLLVTKETVAEFKPQWGAK